MSEKTSGYILLVIGIILILLAGISVYSVFTKLAKPVELFNFPAISIDSSQLVAGAPSKQVELVKGSVLNDSSNIFAHVILMGFVASIGYRIGSLGVMLLRPVNVKMKEDKSQTILK